jgi:hypothetical protein
MQRPPLRLQRAVGQQFGTYKTVNIRQSWQLLVVSAHLKQSKWHI